MSLGKCASVLRQELMEEVGVVFQNALQFLRHFFLFLFLFFTKDFGVLNPVHFIVIVDSSLLAVHCIHIDPIDVKQDFDCLYPSVNSKIELNLANLIT